MLWEQVLTLVIAGLIILCVWSIFKKLFKLFFYVGIVLLIIIALNTFFIYRDIVDLRENFSSSEKKIILVDGSKILTGFLFNGGVSFLGGNQLDEYSTYLNNGDYEKILGDSYKLMIFDVDIASNLGNEIDIGGRTILRDDAISILRSEKEISPREKAALFSSILSTNILTSQNPLFFFSEFKKGNIRIYPETALFKMVKVAPTFIIKDIGINLYEKTKETAKTLIGGMEE